MLTFLAVLYAVAAACSLWGAFGPSIRASRRAQKGERAKARLRELTQVAADARGVGDEAAAAAAWEARRVELAAPFEGGQRTLGSWAEGGARYISEADRAQAESASRRAGLGWIGVGVALGSVASIIGLWL